MYGVLPFGVVLVPNRMIRVAEVTHQLRCDPAMAPGFRHNITQRVFRTEDLMLRLYTLKSGDLAVRHSIHLTSV